MSLINPAILWGLGLVSIPVILHILLRSRPKKYLFPALRLVRARRQNNIRRLRVKHLWLLLLRMAVLALLVLAIARPTLPAANYNPSTGESLRTAGIAAAGIVAYLWIVRAWKRRRLPHHVLSYRRTLLRAGTGAATLFAFLLAVVLPYERRIAAEISSPRPTVAENLPVAAVFLFDTSLSMSYRHRNFTRLEEAQKIAAEHMGRLPPGSRVAVAETSTDLPLVFQAEPVGALDRLKKLQPRAVSLPLADRIRAALALEEDDYKRTIAGQGSVPEDRRRDRYLREIYVFTDLTAAGWRVGDFKALKAELDRLSSVQLYVIDVGVEKVTNAAIIGPKLSAQSIPQGTDLTLEAAVDAVGFENDSVRILELYVQDESGQLTQREKRTLKARPGKPAAANFVIGRLSRAVTQGKLRLVSSDPYAADDVRYFTVAVTRPLEVVVAGESRDETRLLEMAIAPTELVRQGKARCHVKYVPVGALGDVDLKKVDVVCLVNAASPSQSVWSSLGEFVAAGGGLFVIAGNSRVTAAAYNVDAAQLLLPARLTANVKLPEPATLDLRDFNHPLFKKFAAYDGGFGELATAKVYRRWGAEPQAGASIITAYTDPHASPALLVRPHGAGQTLLLTTSLDRRGWNDLAIAGWPFVVFVDQTIHYLSRRSEARYNYDAGEDVTIPLPPELPLHAYWLQKPGGEQLPGEIVSSRQAITVRDVDQVGQYGIVSRDEKVQYASGFSANVPAPESDFTRVTSDELNHRLGRGRYSVARSVEGLTRNVTVGRVGQEVFSLLLGIVIVVFCLEHFVANRFYESEQSPEHR